jgi:murein DD-endopeptidase MepM/ murein hydrolase activator NlpD
MSVFKNSGFKVTSVFGMRTHPITKAQEFHRGIDLVTADKAPLPSFTDGKVIHAGWGNSGTGLGDMGNVVAIVEPGTGYCHIYAHLDSVNVKLGDEVKLGDDIGTQGNTGASAGSHLHYEIRKKSTPSFGWTPSEKDRIDPEVYFAGKILPSKPSGSAPAKSSIISKIASKPKTPTTTNAIYTIKSGDTLGKIASANGITLNELLAKNPQIKNANVISVGQKINL